jgi:hypothetical protein
MRFRSVIHVGWLQPLRPILRGSLRWQAVRQLDARILLSPHARYLSDSAHVVVNPHGAYYAIASSGLHAPVEAQRAA